MSAADYSMRNLNIGLITTCLIGLVLSCYSYNVEIRREENELYKPMCDISEHVSCTKAFMSEYGKGFGLFPKNSMFRLDEVPNPVFGIIFYSLIILLSTRNNNKCVLVIVVLGLISNFCSLYLAYVLFKMKNICIVCVALYVVNATIWYFALQKFKLLCSETSRRKKNKKSE